MAARVQPPLLEKELVDMFMGTLHEPYLEKLIRGTYAGFSDLVVVSKWIENCLKIDKIQDTTTTASGAKKYHFGFSKKKEGGTNATTIAKGEGTYQIPYYQVATVAPNPYQQPTYSIPIGPSPVQYQQPYAPQWHNPYQQGQYKRRKPKTRIYMIPMSYSQLLAHFLQDSLVQYRELRPPPKPLPQGYDANSRCEFHSRAPEHTVENCRALKHKV